MAHPTEALLKESNPPDELLAALYRIGREPVPELRGSIARLMDHDNPDIREEALRILVTRWKDQSLRDSAVEALRLDPDVCVRSAAAFGVATLSTELSRNADTELLLELIADEREESDVRAAAYDALLILYRTAAFPTKKRAFDPKRDVNWTWITQLRTLIRRT